MMIGNQKQHGLALAPIKPQKSQQSFDRGNRSTYAKSQRQFQFTLLQKTNFQSEKSQYLTTISQIHQLRVIQYLGRYLDLPLKLNKLDQLQTLVKRAKQLLDNMAVACEVYKQLLEVEPWPSGYKAMPQTSEESFVARMGREVRAVEAAWNQLVREGSLKKLEGVLAVLGIQRRVDLEVDIKRWVSEAEKCFKTPLRKGCCKRLMEIS